MVLVSNSEYEIYLFDRSVILYSNDSLCNYTGDIEMLEAKEIYVK